MGKIDEKVFIFFLEYPPFTDLLAVPVFPPTSYPLTLANLAVPSNTIFLKIKLWEKYNNRI